MYNISFTLGFKEEMRTTKTIESQIRKFLYYVPIFYRINCNRDIDSTFMFTTIRGSMVRKLCSFVIQKSKRTTLDSDELISLFEEYFLSR